jgi:hypothetical protein
VTLRVYELDGAEFRDLKGFASLFSAVVLDGHVWSGNLDALNDVLRGGFGTPAGGFVLRVLNCREARQALGYAETARWFEEHASTCHPSNRDDKRRRAQEARAGVGETLFDMVLEIIRLHGPGGDEHPDNVVLELDEPSDPGRGRAGVAWFEQYCDTLDNASVIAERRKGERYRCPCCRYRTLFSRGHFEICPVCFWEDDGQDDHDADIVRGGPNGSLSLTAARANFDDFGASEHCLLAHVRAPHPDEK